MKKIFTTVLIALFAISLNAQNNETAHEAVKNMGVGWNLGNTLDANGANGNDPAISTYWGQQGLDSENYWGQPTTQAKLMKMMKEAGFGAIRVPVTWYNHMDKDGKVNAAWMKRVHEVVDYVIDNDMYCIINVHHDTGADGTNSKSWLKADEAWYNNYKAKYEYLWKQIADEFKDYDGKLLFESYNEMLDTDNSWCFASFNASGNYNAAKATSAYNAINSYAQSFVNVVRAAGGKNIDRNLIVNTYAAANGYGTWNTHLKEPLTKMNMPQDVVNNHIIFEVHSYPAISNKNSQGVVTDRAWTDIKKEIDESINLLKTNLISKGAPVIIGEYGTSNVDAGEGKTDYDARRTLMLQFVDYYVKQAKVNGIAMFYWMGLSDSAYRLEPSFNQPDLAECMVKAYHGKDFQGVYPEPMTYSSVTCFEGNKLLEWGQGITIQGNAFKSVGDGAQLELTYQLEITDYDDIQFYLGDWSNKISFIVNNKSFSADFAPKNYYNSPNGTKHTTVFSFDKATYELLSQKGLVIQGHGIRLSKATLFDPSATGIESTKAEEHPHMGIYNLTGQEVKNATKGIYIKNGKKFLVK